jgi:acyl-CoA synthetase (AMP-forming)/AMP-acid ligase II
VQRPYRWLAAASRYGATSIGAPNFGYELCIRKITDADLQSLDLSSIAMAFCSAEPIRAATIERFVQRFRRCGFSPTAFRPSYGLAEATVVVCGEMGTLGARIRLCDREALLEGRFVEAPAHSVAGAAEVSCGTALGGQEIVIAGPNGARATGSEIGEIWLRGPSVAAGYWSNRTATEDVFGGRLTDGSGPYLKTGDLGWLSPSGELFVLGRRKDLIIVRGQNYYPQDIEEAVESATSSVRAGCIAAFSFDTPLGESVALVCEPAAAAGSPPAEWPKAIAAIRGKVSEKLGLALSTVALVERGTIPKTASGKVQRSLARGDFLGGRLSLVHLWRANNALDSSSAPRGNAEV